MPKEPDKKGARPVDWTRIRGQEPGADERPPFRLGGAAEEGVEGSAVDPWKALLERGSMQEVLASVRRVAGVPEDEPPASPRDEPLPAEAPSRRDPEPPAAARRAGAELSPSVTARRRRVVPDPSAAAPSRPSAPSTKGTTEAPKDARRGTEPVDARPARRTEPPAPPPRAAARADRQTGRGPTPAAVRPGTSPSPEDERVAAERRKDRAVPPPVQDPEDDPRAGHAPDTGSTDDTPALIPRRAGVGRPAARSREFGPLAIATVLVMGLALGVGLGYLVRSDSWTIHWPEVFADVEPGAGSAEEQEGVGTALPPIVESTELTPADTVLPPADDLDRGAGGPLLEPMDDDAVGGAPAPVVGEDVAALDIAPLFVGRVFVHYSTSDDSEGARSRALEVARALEQRGYRIAAVRPVDFTIQSSSVRYFFPDDLAAAARLQEDLPADTATRTRLMDFTSYEPRPREGTIELWLDPAS